MKKFLMSLLCVCLLLAIVGCNYAQEQTASPTLPAEHVHKYVTTIISPSCTQKGYTEYNCDCGDSYIDNEIPMFEHDYSEKIIEATCVHAGKTLYACKNCDYVCIDNEIPPLGHDYVTDTIKPTYTEKGYDVYTCSRCGDIYQDNETDIIPHDHKYDKKVTEPTCTKKGYTTHTCSLCGKSYKDSETEMKAHDYKTKTVAPTCKEKGYDIHICSNCKHEYKDNYTEMIPHQYETKTVEPTCTEKGYDFDGCVICGDGKKSNETNALGHDYVTEIVKPTAKEKGYDLHKCSRCGDSYKDNYTDPVVTYKEVNETVYAKSDVNIRKGPSTDFEKIGSLSKGDSIVRIGIGDNDWSKVMYNDEVAYIHSDYLSTEKPPVVSANGYPKTYSDSTATITITKEKFKSSWCYIAHLKFTDYTRFGTTCGNDKLGGYETTSHAAKRVGAIFAVNGPYMGKEYSVVRNGKVFYDVPIIADLAIYNIATGKLENAGELGLTGMKASEAVEKGLISDTFKFYNSTLVSGGKNVANPNNNDRAQRTFMGTTGNAGELYIIVSEGRYADGESNGLRKYDCASLLVELGCTYGVMLDGGGSSTMYFNGKVLNSANGNQRSVIDFVYFK